MNTKNAANTLLKEVDNWYAENDKMIPGTFTLEFGDAGPRIDPGPRLSQSSLDAIRKLGPIAIPRVEALEAWSKSSGTDSGDSPLASMGFLGSLVDNGVRETLRRFAI